MVLAVVLVVIIIASVLFHLLSPWTFTELASNWGAMDTMFQVSMAITGLVFVLVTLFVVWALLRFRHREGHTAQYEPDNKRLEWWLIGITTAGIVALLAPGLWIYADFVRAPDDAIRVEVVGQQWQYSYRYPGPDGELGRTDTRLISFDNPFGMDPDDPRGHDDILIQGGDLRLPVGQPVRLKLRSKDVLHSVFVPQFRAKMDMVPGMVTSFWLTPTRTGRFEILCSQHCGIGHFNMRGVVEVMEREAFDAWLERQPTYAEQLTQLGARVEDEDVARGRRLVDGAGCFACHSLDGSRRVGPTWLGLYGSQVELADGTTVLADADYLRESIVNPGAQLTRGYPPVMQAYTFSDDEMAAIIAFLRTLGEGAEVPPDMTEAVDDTPPPEPAVAEAREPSIEWGQELASRHGCYACHSTDGSRQLGPTWRNLYGRSVELVDGSTVVADADYIKLSITNPGAQLTAGYPPVMQPYPFSEAELESMVMYIRDALSD